MKLWKMQICRMANPSLMARSMISSESIDQISISKPVRVAIYSSKKYDISHLQKANAKHGHSLHFLDARLSNKTACLANGFDVVCSFVNDPIHAETIAILAKGGIKLIALRCAGFNQVDIATASKSGIAVCRVPKYSPYAVAEHAVAMMLTLNRKTHRAFNRVREDNFALDGLLGFDMHGKTVGIIGTGKIGSVLFNICKGFGCRVIGYDAYPNPELQAAGMKYVSLSELFSQSDIISLHTPLTKETTHLINDQSIALLKHGSMIVNTSRGGLVDTGAIIRGLKSGKVQYFGADVYEQEADLFFEDRSDNLIQDDAFQLLHTFHNVLITGHMAFFTSEALTNISETTMENITSFFNGKPTNLVPL